jgi:uncharacterized protein
MTAARLATAANSHAVLLVWLAILLAVPARAAAPKFPVLTGRVVDDAGVLSSSARNDLTETLAQLERATGEQVVVVTLPSLQGLTIEDFGYQLGRAWGIGQKGKNTGALLIVAPKEHRVRIEVGYGLEGKLTDAESRVIIERDILPALRHGDFDAGVTAGTAAILTVLGGNAASLAPTGQRDDASGSSPESGVLSPMVILIFGVYGLFYLFAMLRANRYRAGRGGAMWRSSTYDPFAVRGPFIGGGGFGGGGFGGGGGFAGGGGSFGGGGASAGW